MHLYDRNMVQDTKCRVETNNRKAVVVCAPHIGERASYSTELKSLFVKLYFIYPWWIFCVDSLIAKKEGDNLTNVIVVNF